MQQWTWVVAIGILGACSPPGMRSLYAPPQDLGYAIDPSCEVAFKGDKAEAVGAADVDCKEERRRGMTRRAQTGLFTDFGKEDEGIRLVLLGDAGVRGASPREVGDGPAAVLAHAERTCAGACDGVVLLGDNLYNHGVEAADDSAFFEAFATAWSVIGPQYYVPGNHDWGTFPIVKPPRTSRVQRELGEIRRLQARGIEVRGDSHFWSTTVGGGRLVGLDTTYLVRGCRLKGGEVRCAGDPKVEDAERVRFRTLVEGVATPGTGPSIVVGHHPWRSHGEHGEAGDYYDYRLFGPVAQGHQKGAALRSILDEIVAPNAAIYLSGHDHNTQVFRMDDATLSVVVGAGGKVSPPGKATAVGAERHLPGLELERYCQLGYAILEVRPASLSLEVHTLPAAIAADKDRERVQECLAEFQARRPEELIEDSPSCIAWNWSQTDGTVGSWSSAGACAAD